MLVNRSEQVLGGATETKLLSFAARVIKSI